MRNRSNKIVLVVPVHNRRQVTLNYLRQIQEICEKSISLDIVIVDDGSTDGTADAIQEIYPAITVLKGSGNLWWTGAVNMGVNYALERSYDSVLIMNDDLDLDKDFLSHLLKVSDKYPEALINSVTIHKSEEGNEEILTAGFKRVGFFYEIQTLHVGEQYSEKLPEVLCVDLLTGASLLVPTKVFRKIGIFDEKNFPHSWGDFEFTLRASLHGYACLVATKSKVYTEYNPNYSVWYLLRASRKQYLKNLFNSHKFFYGFRAIRKASYMYRPFWLGTLLYVRRLVGLLKAVLLKLCLTRSQLRIYLLSRALRKGAPDFLVRKLKSCH